MPSDNDILRELRQNKKHKEAFDFVMKKYRENPNSFYAIKELIVCSFDVNPLNVEFLYELGQKIENSKYSDYAHFAYTCYFLKKDNYDLAFSNASQIQKGYLISKLNKAYSIYPNGQRLKHEMFSIENKLAEYDELPDSNSKKSKVAFDIAEYYFRKTQFFDAIKFFNKSLEQRIEGNKSICHFWLGKCYIAIKNYNKSIYYLNLALKEEELQQSNGINKKNSINKIYTELGSVYIKVRDFKNAKKCIDYLLNGTKKDVNLALILTSSLLRLNSNFEEAKNVLKRLDSPDSQELSLAKSEKIEIALAENKMDDVKDLIEGTPDHVYVIPKLKYYHRTQNVYDGILYCDRLIQRNIFKYEAYISKAQLLEIWKNYDECDKIYEVVLNSNYKLRYLTNITGYYNRTNRFDKTESIYESVISEVENNPDYKNKNGLYLDLLHAYIQNNSYDKIFILNKNFIKVSKNNVTRHVLRYAASLIKIELYEEAYEVLKNVEDTEFENDGIIIKARIERYLGNKEEAIKLINTNEYTKTNNESYLLQFRMLCDDKKYEEALTTIDNVTNPDYERKKLFLKLEVYLKNGQIDKAKEIYDYVCEKNRINDDAKKMYHDFFLFINNEDISQTDLYKSIKSALRNSEIYTDGKYYDYYLSGSGYNDFTIDEEEFIKIIENSINNLGKLDSYLNGIYESYIIDVGKIVGYAAKKETSYISIKCLVNTNKIVSIRPTRRRINNNKYTLFTRKKKLDEESK